MPIGWASENETYSIPSNPINLASTGSSESVNENNEDFEEKVKPVPEQQDSDTRAVRESDILEAENQKAKPSSDSIEDIVRNVDQTWTGTELREFPLTVSYMSDLLRPELIPDEVKYITTANSSMSGFWRLNGQSLNPGTTISANSSYSVIDIEAPGSNRLVDISITPQRIGGSYSVRNSIGAFTSGSAGSRIDGGQVQVVYSDDKTPVDGFVLVGIAGANSTTQTIPKEELKGIVVTLNTPRVSITETEDAYIFNFGNSNDPIGIIVPTTYTHTSTSGGASQGFRFWRDLSGIDDSPWTPQFNSIQMNGLVEEEKFVSKFEIKQDVPILSGGDYKLTLSNNLPMSSNPSFVFLDENEEELDVGSLEINEQGQTEILLSSSEMAQFRGKTMRVIVEFPLITSNQSNLSEFLNDEGYVSIPLSAKNNKENNEVSATAQTWVRPWGEAVHQEIGLNTSTSELDPAIFIKNLDNKLVGDAPFVVGFAEERAFDTLGETSIGIVIESAISGIQNMIDVPVTVIENKGSVFVHHVDKDGKTLSDSEELIGIIGEEYETQAKIIKNYHVTEEPDNAKGVYQEKAIDVTYIYDIAPVLPVDPLDPDKEIAPENPPVRPEDQGLFSIDFVSQFDFGNQVISAQDQTYYAQPQRLLNEDGTVNETEERPNYVQISDRRPTQDRDGWELAVRQNDQFHTETGAELVGARLILQNQQLATAQGSIEPGLQHTNPMVLNPGGAKRTLLKAQGNEGVGTWIYRFGNADSAAQSVALEVPKGATPSAESYTTTLTWELSSVPNN
jgi:hypothetical protein